ncbi:2-haloalkanoic acid dehalogenase [Blumeria hordei DH14]|uniref:2-haloalkanoic acid dehalogenase n=1 Tax=Blumeria graminis f. sp. hordei (strain DH14) TaxID=546991 RepID=N1J519_BLUG1|nr:2-haloalkanoic acid dehalogenase [Blumeria hordei DH14]
MTKHIVFDVVGTCVSYDVFVQAIEQRLGPQLRAVGISPRLFSFAWQEAAEREYTYLSISGAYRSFISSVFPQLFQRMLHMAGVPDPSTFASADDVAYIVSAYASLEVRPGLKKCFEHLRAAGFTVWALTSGDVERVRGYFIRGGVEMPMANFISCDSLSVGKPHPEVYRHALEQIQSSEKPWFAAAHTWDVGAAGRHGFRTAWCSVFEKFPCVDIFGEMEVNADSLPELAEKVIATSQ